MEDKLLKILKIKIDAINRNIDNLNYLNGELERNSKDLEYIEDKIELFKDGDILKFENIGKDDFNKILLMVNSSVSDIFKDKTCNYDGIIYIIEGIKKSISLQLTSEQTNAIMAFIEGLKDKRDNLIETISNLNESKNRLPETDLSILTNNLDKFNDIVSKFENKLYLTEIDEIGDALNFADVLVEEKVDIYEFILKYNSDIYTTRGEEYSKSDNFINKEEANLDLPDFNTINVTHDLLDEKEKEEATEEKELDKENDTSFDDIKFNLDKFNLDSEIKEEEKPADGIDFELPPINFDNNYDLPKFNADLDTDLNVEPEQTALKEEESHELNTIELEDIIKKIDAKLKEMETDEKNETEEKSQEEVKKIEVEEPKIELPKVEENNPEEVSYSNQFGNNEVNGLENISETEISNEIDEANKIDVEPIASAEPKITLNELYNKYSIGELKIDNQDLDDVDKMLGILVDNNLLDVFKENKNILEIMLSKYKNTELEELINLIKENLIVKNDEFIDTVNILIETLPILFTKVEVFNDFKGNINFYKEKNINIINILDNYRELLIIKNESLVDNYNKVISYGLEINSDNVKYFLYNKNVLTNIDYYIEAIGYEKGFLGKEDRFDGVTYIKKNPYKLNGASRDMLLKLRYTSENNGKIYGNKPGILSGEISNPKVDIIKLPEEYLSSYFNGEYTTISKSELDNELANLKEFDMTLDGALNIIDQKYKKDELRYQIDNVIISRIKTIRIYNYLKTKTSSIDALIIALTYNSVLKNSEYESIVNIVNNTVGGM